MWNGVIKMSKKIFTITRKVREKIQKAIKEFNNKIDKAKKRGLTSNQLPDKLNYNDVMMKQIYNENDVKTLFKLTNTMNKKNSTDIVQAKAGAKITKALDNYFKIQTKEKNKHIREKQLAYKNKGTIEGRKMTADEYNLMQNTLNSSKIREYNYNLDSKRQVDIPWIKKALKNYSEPYNAHDEIYKQNYIKSLKEVLPTWAYKKMKKYMETVPAEQLAISYHTDTSLKIEVNYLHDGDDPDTIKEFMKRTIHDWNKTLNRNDDEKLFDEIDNSKHMSNEAIEEWQRNKKNEYAEQKELYNTLKHTKEQNGKLSQKQEQFIKWFERRY